MSIYEWNGPEESLGGMPITAVRMTIEQFEEKDGVASAKGTFVFHDHIEGCESGELPWEAKGGPQNWSVRCTDDDTVYFRAKDTGEVLFSLCEPVNDGIKNLISRKLSWVADYKKKNPGKPLDFVEECPRFAGTKHEYTGECLCAELEVSGLRTNFPWAKHTNNGQYPKRCFQCSCGEKWYLGNPGRHLWARVKDEKAWEMLTEFDGVAVMPIAVRPRSDPPHFVLLSNLRKEGFIPL
jgi:hypothetical protein